MQTEKGQRNKWKIAATLLGMVVIVETLVLYDTFYLKGGSLGLPWATAQFYDAGNYVGAGGSWISDSDGGTISQQPINTTDISCYQPRGSCSEARASKEKGGTGNILAQLLEYEIKSWTPQEVVAVLQGRAGTIEIHFDRLRREVTMVEKAGIEGAAHLGGGLQAIDASRK